MKEKPVKDIELKKGMNTDDLVKELFESGGFTAKDVGIGVDIIERMIKDNKCVKFLSFPACIISTGARGIIKDLLKKKLILLSYYYNFNQNINTK